MKRIVIFILLSQTLDVIAQKNSGISINTYALKNTPYLAAQNWHNIPINNKLGDDLKSKHKKNINLKERGHVQKSMTFEDENRHTLANKNLRIEVDISQTKDKDWVLTDIKPIIIDTFAIRGLDVTVDNWAFGGKKINSCVYQITFTNGEHPSNVSLDRCRMPVRFKK